uniref:Uncharacterized protein n=1 Tax=Meloidogyne incognita TaxID=6306 RepID=A0A914MXX0_MELIC
MRAERKFVRTTTVNYNSSQPARVQQSSWEIRAPTCLRQGPCPRSPVVVVAVVERLFVAAATSSSSRQAQLLRLATPRHRLVETSRPTCELLGHEEIGRRAMTATKFNVDKSG